MNKDDSNEEFDLTSNADHELNSSEWFGAILRYFSHLGREPFNTFYQPKDLKKNALVGWLFKMFLVLAISVLVYFYC